MAVLETIRAKKKILAIVIGSALLAFIVEAGVEALGRFNGNSTAAVVDGEKIDYMDLQKEVEKVAALEQNQQQNGVDQALRQQKVLEGMISDKLLETEYEEVGISVTDLEISELMTGKTAVQPAVQMAQQVGVESPAQLNEMLNNPAKFGAQPEQVLELKAQWDKLTQDIAKQYRMIKLQSLIAGGIQANDLDRKQMLEDEGNIAHINFVKKDYASLNDKDFKVTDEEIKAEWEKNKKAYALQEETRLIQFIAVNIAPNEADKAAAKAIADKALAALKEGTGIDAVRALGTVKVDTAKVAENNVPANVKALFAGKAAPFAAEDSTASVDGKHMMYKLMRQESLLDTVKANIVSVPGDKAAQDKALAMLNEGKTVEEVAKDVKGAQGQKDQEISVAMFPADMHKKIEGAGSEYFVLVSNEQGAQIMQVTEKKAPVTYITYATVSYDAFASEKTSNELRDKLQKFIGKNQNTADLVKNAAAAGYQAIEAQVTANTPQLGMNPYTGSGIKDSRKAIKWAFDAKKGQVSPIFTDNNDMLIVIAVEEIYDGDYLPYNAKGVKEGLEAQVRNSKKGDKLMKDFNGKAKDLNGYASLMKVKVDTTTVNFGSDMALKLDGETGLIGRVAATPKGKFVGLWKGNNAVYAYQVTDIEKDKRTRSNKELNDKYAQTRGGLLFANPTAMTAVLSKALKVERKLVNFQ